MNTSHNKPTVVACGLLLCVILVLVITGIQYKIGIQVPLFLSWFCIYIFAYLQKINIKSVENAAYDMIRTSFGVIMIVLVTGALISSWLASGTVPTLIYYGLKIIHPHFFLLTTLLLCSVISIFTGTSYGTAGTVGLAMMVVGSAMNIPIGWIAGAVISGSLFGDKLSILSDTTNLAAGVSETNIYEHIKHMLYTTVPAYIVTAMIFTVLSMTSNVIETTSIGVTMNIMSTLDDSFNISVITLVPLVLVVYLLVKKVSPIITIMIGTVLGMGIAIILQDVTIKNMLQYLWSGYVYTGDSEFLVRMLNRGGLQNMLGIFLTSVLGLGMGGMLKQVGVLDVLMTVIIKKVTTIGNLILTTMVSCYIVAMLSATQTFSIVLTGTIFKPIYEKMNLDSRNLSRTLEDAGTMGGVFFPWHTNAVFFSGVLGVAWNDYLPFCFLSIITPVVALIYGYTNTFIKHSEINNDTSVTNGT